MTFDYPLLCILSSAGTVANWVKNIILFVKLGLSLIAMIPSFQSFESSHMGFYNLQRFWRGLSLQEKKDKIISLRISIWYVLFLLSSLCVCVHFDKPWLIRKAQVWPMGYNLLPTIREDAEAEAPVFWSSDVNSQLIGKVADDGKDWGQKEKGVSKDEIVGWHHRRNGHELG